MALTLAVAALSVSLASRSALADATWTGSTSSDWNNAANWGGTSPTGNFFVNTATGNFPVITGTPAFTPVDLILGDGAGQSGRLDQSAGTLALANTGTNGTWMQVGRNGGTGTYNLTGTGSLAVGKLWMGGFVYGENGTGTVTINTTGSVTANSTDDFSNFSQYHASVIVGWGSFPSGPAVGTLNLQNGTLNANGFGMYVGAWGSTGTVNQTGGTINTVDLSVGRWFGTGGMTVANGTVNASGGVWLARAGAAADNIQGTMTVKAGGVVNSEGDMTIGFAGSAASQGTLTVDGGTVNVASTAERWMIVGQYDSVGAAVDVKNGGTLNLKAGADIRTSVGGNTAARVINVNGGSILGTGAANGDASVIELGRGGAGSDTVNITNGGVIAAKAIYAVGNSTSAVLNFNNGTLRSLGDDTFFVGLTGTGTRAVNILGGGAKLDTNGFNGSVQNGLLAGDALNGGVTKQGAGTLTLLGVNTYTGNTVVSDGSLVLADNAGLKFAIGASGVNNKLTGTGVVQLDGDFTFDLSSAATAAGSAWNVVDVANLAETFGATFQVNDFVADAGGVLWTKAINAGKSYQFSEATGVLSVVAVPEPTTLGAVFAAGSLLLARRRRGR